MESTTNIGLHQWQAGDAFLRTDFNEDFGKIDAAIAAAPGKAHVVGVYRGSGNKNSPTVIETGFSPSAVLFFDIGNQSDAVPALLVRGEELGAGSTYPIARITATGFTVFLAVDPGNQIAIKPVLNSTSRYCYIAFR